jgi:hypothetical protein
LYTSRTTKAPRLRAVRQFPDRLPGPVDHWSSKKSLQNSFTEDAIPQVVRLLPVNPQTHPRSASSFHFIPPTYSDTSPQTLAHQSSCQGDSKWVSAYTPRSMSMPTLGMLLHTFTVFARELPPPVPASVRSTAHLHIVNPPPKTCCTHQSLRNPHHYPPLSNTTKPAHTHNCNRENTTSPTAQSQTGSVFEKHGPSSIVDTEAQVRHPNNAVPDSCQSSSSTTITTGARVRTHIKPALPHTTSTDRPS